MLKVFFLTHPLYSSFHLTLTINRKKSLYVKRVPVAVLGTPYGELRALRIICERDKMIYTIINIMCVRKEHDQIL